MEKKQKYLEEIRRVEAIVKAREQRSWSKTEIAAIALRGGVEESDFFKIWDHLCYIENMKHWVLKYGTLPKSYLRMLREMKGSSSATCRRSNGVATPGGPSKKIRWNL